MLMTNKLTLPVESRMQGDLHVRFGGRLWETYHRKVVRRPSPSLLPITKVQIKNVIKKQTRNKNAPKKSKATENVENN